MKKHERSKIKFRMPQEAVHSTSEIRQNNYRVMPLIVGSIMQRIRSLNSGSIKIT